VNITGHKSRIAWREENEREEYRLIVPTLVCEPDGEPLAASLPGRVIDAMDTPLVVLDADLQIILANQAFYCLFAVSPTQAIGNSFRTVVGPWPGLAEAIDHFASEADAHEREIEVTLPEMGRRIMRLAVWRSGEGGLGGGEISVSMRDVTERKRNEAELVSAKWRAERDRLNQSQLLAAASHELRQPMQTLDLMRAVLAKRLKRREDAEALKLISQIKETADAMSGVLSTLLEVNQLEAGEVRPQKEDFAIRPLFERLIVEFAYHTQAQGLGLRVVPSKSFVHSDPHLLEQIIRNFLSNAVKYTTTGRLLLGCRRRGDKLRIEVWDTGRGIAETEFSSIFREFHRLDESTRERRRGFGLGLSIVRRFSDLLGHVVYVHSRPGAGSVFAIEVPLSSEPKEEASKPRLLDPARHLGRSAAILIIESDPTIREMLDCLFADEGYRVFTASGGKDALKLARTVSRLDIVIAGYHLREDAIGPQTVADIRELLGRKLPAIILTGHISTDIAREITRQDCVPRTKPASAEELVHLVESLLVKHEAVETRAHAPGGVGHRRGIRRPTIFVVDNDSTVREGLQSLFRDDEGWSVETYPNAISFLDALGSRRDAVLIVGSQMPGLSGIELLERLNVEGRALPAIMATGHADVRLAVRAMKAGVIAFLEKPVQFDELMGHVEQALDRARDSAARSLWHKAAAKRISALTPREKEVMTLVIEGNANKKMAYVLGINQRTVESHRAAIMRKLGARSLSDLIHIAIAAAPQHA
jgi:two-component system CheB/CheR fusion protein